MFVKMTSFLVDAVNVTVFTVTDYSSKFLSHRMYENHRLERFPQRFADEKSACVEVNGLKKGPQKVNLMFVCLKYRSFYQSSDHKSTWWTQVELFLYLWREVLVCG